MMELLFGWIFFGIVSSILYRFVIERETDPKLNLIWNLIVILCGPVGFLASCILSAIYIFKY